MIVHKNWVINLSLSSLICLSCFIGDKKLHAANEPQLMRAFYDNVTHGLIGLFASAILFVDDMDKIYLSVICMIISSLIDIDHFCAAKSFRLADATNLQNRPFLHNSTIPLVLIFILIYCHLTSQNNLIILALTIVLIAFITHHIRDANRRGLTFSPFYQTPPIPYFLYIGLIIITPFIFKIFMVNDFKYRRLVSNTSQPIFEV